MLNPTLLSHAENTLSNYTYEKKNLLRAIKTARKSGVDPTELELRVQQLSERISRQKKRVKALRIEHGEYWQETAYLSGEPGASAQWRPSPLLGARYEVSDDGFVRNARTQRVVKRCVHGRRAVVHVLGPDNRPNSYMLARLVYEAWIGPLTPKEVEHDDDNKFNCAKENLICGRSN